MGPENDRAAKRVFTTLMQKSHINSGRVTRQSIQGTHFVVH